LVASDKDLKQCLTPNVYLWDPAGKNEKVTSQAAEADEAVHAAHQRQGRALQSDGAARVVLRRQLRQLKQKSQRVAPLAS